MKELEVKVKEEIKIVKEVSQEKQLVLVNSIKPYEGHKCFEYNVLVNTLSFAKFMEVSISFEAAQKGEIAPLREVMTKEGCVYLTALNEKNAIKRLSKMFEKPITPNWIESDENNK